MSNTRFPLASVCCKLFESAESAAVGPKELIIAITATIAWSALTVPCSAKCPQTAAIRTPAIRITPSVTMHCVFSAIFNFWFFCSNCSVWLFISLRRFSCCPYCKISSSPYRLSRTTVLWNRLYLLFAFVLYLFCFCFHIRLSFQICPLCFYSWQHFCPQSIPSVVSFY